jgi:hypothetical protein
VPPIFIVCGDVKHVSEPLRSIAVVGTCGLQQSSGYKATCPLRCMVTFDKELVREAKAIVALALRTGPLEDLHRGVPCPTCLGEYGYSRITNAEMKKIMKAAVSQVFRLLWLRDHDSEGYQREVRRGEFYTSSWDDPDMPAS